MYIAQRDLKIQVGDKVELRRRGEPVPEAADWKYLGLYLQQGAVRVMTARELEALSRGSEPVEVVVEVPVGVEKIVEGEKIVEVPVEKPADTDTDTDADPETSVEAEVEEVVEVEAAADPPVTATDEVETPTPKPRSRRSRKPKK